MATNAAALLRRWLQRQGLTQTAFAEKIGRPQSVVSRLIGARRRPDLDTAIAIARVTKRAVPVEAWERRDSLSAA